MKFKIVFSTIVLSVLISSCNNNSASSNDNNETIETPEADIESSSVEIQGKVVFEQKCAPCHGSDGTAGTGNASNLQLSKLDRDSVSKVIAEGRMGMPSFASQITKEETAELSNYILTLQK